MDLNQGTIVAQLIASLRQDLMDLVSNPRTVLNREQYLFIVYLQDKLLLKQSMSQEKSLDKTPGLEHKAFSFSTPSPAPAAQVLLYPAKQSIQSSNSVILASLTKPVVSSQKLGGQPHAVITSAVMGKKEEEKTSETPPRSQAAQVSQVRGQLISLYFCFCLGISSLHYIHLCVYNI